MGSPKQGYDEIIDTTISRHCYFAAVSNLRIWQPFVSSRWL